METDKPNEFTFKGVPWIPDLQSAMGIEPVLLKPVYSTAISAKLAAQVSDDAIAKFQKHMEEDVTALLHSAWDDGARRACLLAKRLMSKGPLNCAEFFEGSE